MLRLLKFLITGDWHVHRWSLDGEKARIECGIVTGVDKTYRCATCGQTKVVFRRPH